MELSAKSNPRESLATLVRGDPDQAGAAAAFGARFVLTTAVAVGAALLIGGPAAATPASMASIFIQLGRPLPARWGARMIAGVSIAALLGVGATVAVLLNGPMAAVVAIVLAFAVALAARGSAIAAIARDPLLIIFIFMGGVPSTPANALPAGIGGALAALLVVTITGLLERPGGSDVATVIAARLNSMAEALERGAGPAAGVDTMRIAVGTLATPIGSGRSGQALAGLMANVERQEMLLLRIERDWRGPPPDLSRFAQRDRACALSLLGAPPPDEEAEAEELERIAGQLMLLDLETTTANTLVLTRRARGYATPLRDRALREAPAPTISRSRTRIAAWRVLALVSLRSAAMREALRLAAATGLAVAAIELLPVGRGYWVMMSTVVALRASGQTTLAFGRYQAIGTLGGFAVALVPVLLGAGAVVSFSIAGVALFFYAFARRAGAPLLGPAALTVVFVMALGQLTGSGLQIGSERVIDVGLGIAIAVFVAIAIWPGGRERLVARALAESFDTSAALIRVTGAWLIRGTGGADTDAAWREALVAGARAEEALTAVAATPHVPGAEYDRAVGLHAIATRIRFQSADALRLVREETDVATPPDAEVERVAERFARVAAALEKNEFDQIGPAGLEQRAEAPAAQSVYAARVWRWLEEITDEAAAAESLARTLKPVGTA